MRPDLAARAAGLEWAHRNAADSLKGLDWVDSNLDPNIPAFTQIAEGEQRRFSHLPYAVFLPTVMTNAAVQAQRDGQAPMQEALVLLFARMEWMVSNRQRMWSPLSPLPKMLATLVEAFGVDQDLHREDPEILARLAAQLPQWHPCRGTVERAKEVLESTGDLPQADGTYTLGADGPAPKILADEVFVCHTSSWWDERCLPDSAAAYRIDSGVLKFQNASPEKQVPLRCEDLLLEWVPERPLPRQLLRLLPTWVVVRLVLPAESRK
ncbi:MAG: hypothetical protein ACI9VR_004522 [Cognaticolwellia sp.]